MSFRQKIRNNSLTLVMFGIFVFALIGMSFSGWLSNNATLSEHSEPTLSYVAYIGSGEFIEGVFENWESEFLQMWALIILTIYLRQRGSKDSKPLRGKTSEDTHSRYSIINAATWDKKYKALKHSIYSHSLGTAMLAIFIVSFSLHAIGGTVAYNQDSRAHMQEEVSVFEYISSSQFWYESLQNWQSEFLAIGTLLILSIKLRERGSPQSKPVGKRFDRETG